MQQASPHSPTGVSQQYALILNAHSGSSSKEVAERVRQALQRKVGDVLCLETEPQSGAQAAVNEALRREVRTLIVCGGDGTVMSAVNALGRAQRSDVALGIVPTGTANLLATALGLPENVEAALAIALNGKERTIDLGECEGILFAVGLGLGLSEKLVSQTSVLEKEFLGRWAYVRALLREVGARPHRFSFRLDGGELQHSRGVALIVANAGEINQRLRFAPQARMDDGQLDLVIVHRFGFDDLFRWLLKSFNGRLKSDNTISFFQARELEITTDPPLDLQIDGEKIDRKPPLHIQIRRHALRVKVPLVIVK